MAFFAVTWIVIYKKCKFRLKPFLSYNIPLCLHLQESYNNHLTNSTNTPPEPLDSIDDINFLLELHSSIAWSDFFASRKSIKRTWKLQMPISKRIPLNNILQVRGRIITCIMELASFVIGLSSQSKAQMCNLLMAADVRAFHDLLPRHLISSLRIMSGLLPSRKMPARRISHFHQRFANLNNLLPTILVHFPGLQMRISWLF